MTDLRDTTHCPVMPKGDAVPAGEQDERAAFEKECRVSHKMWSADGGYYRNSHIQARWEGWQDATRARMAAPAADHNLWHVDLARFVLTRMGYATHVSRDPGADSKVDHLAADLAGWIARNPAAAPAAGDARDAARYRWLRNHPLDGLEETTPCIRAADNDSKHWALNGADADAAIDAAIAAQQGEGGAA